MVEKNNRFTDFIKVFLFQLGIIIALLLIADLVLWVVAPVSLNGIREKKYTQNLPGLKKEIVYRVDENGFRSLTPVSREKPGNLIRVLCLGASTTEQSTQETPDTWSGLLESYLLEHYKDSDFKFQVMALGYGGCRALDSALWMHDTLDKFKPDIVITLLGVTDLCWAGGPGYAPRTVEQMLKTRDELTVKNVRAKLHDVFHKYSQVYRRVWNIVMKFKNRRDLKAGRLVEWHSVGLQDRRKEYRKCPYVENVTRDPDPIEEFKNSTAWLVHFIESRGVPVIVMGQPVSWKESATQEEVNCRWFFVNTPTGAVRPSGTWLLGEMQRYNRVQEALANGRTVKYLDLDSKIPKTVDYFFDDCHYTDLGSRQVAKAALPVLLETIDDLLKKKQAEHGN